MSDFRQAPKLYHLGQKEKRDFYLLPKNLMNPIFIQLNGKQGNQIKLISVLIGTAGDGSFSVSEKWICDRTGMDQSSYCRAHKALIDRGWLRLEKGKLLVDFRAICGLSEYAGDMSSEKETCDDNMESTCDDSMHNKKTKNKNNIKTYEQGDLQESGERRGFDHVLAHEINEGSRSEEHKEDFGWIELEIKYDEAVRNSDVEYREKERRNDPVDLDSIFEGLFEEEKADSSDREEMNKMFLQEELERNKEWEEYLL